MGVYAGWMKRAARGVTSDTRMTDRVNFSANDLEDVLEKGMRNRHRSSSQQSIRNENPSPTNTGGDWLVYPQQGDTESSDGHYKIRRRTSNVEELLYPMPEQVLGDQPSAEEERKERKKL